jgi:hypothetical protein
MKVFPEEVEAVLDRQPGVRASRVVARAHPRMGEVPVRGDRPEPGRRPIRARSARHAPRCCPRTRSRSSSASSTRFRHRGRQDSPRLTPSRRLPPVVEAAKRTHVLGTAWRAAFPRRGHRRRTGRRGPRGLLATDGADVALFADEERREIVVGESLGPAIVPSLRRLGVEEGGGRREPGEAGRRVRVGGHARCVHVLALRPSHDAVRVQRAPAGIRRGDPCPRGGAGRADRARPRQARAGRGRGREVELDPAARAAAGWGGAHSDLVVDATGRARAIARLLAIPARRGPRDDVAHFAHYTGWACDEAPGYVVIGRIPAVGAGASRCAIDCPSASCSTARSRSASATIRSSVSRRRSPPRPSSPRRSGTPRARATSRRTRTISS